MNRRVFDEATWLDMQREYRRLFGVDLMDVDLDGALRHGVPGCRTCEPDVMREARQRAVQEGLRWGEPSVNLCPAGLALWGLPVMRNNEVVGGLVVEGVSFSVGRARPALTATQIRLACDGLLALAQRYNVTNVALLQAHRQESGRERERAQAIHAVKDHCYDSIRAAYLREEPALLAAIKRGERQTARAIVNRVLVGIYHLGGTRLELLKSLALELIVMMYRAAVEAGGEPSELLGVNFDSISALSRVSSEETLCHWLTDILERLMDGIRDNRRHPNTLLLQQAVKYMAEHVGQPLGRDAVARVAGLSPGHFSRLIKAQTGKSFLDLQAEFRVDRAAEGLVRTEKSLAQIACETGFTDQSHMNRSFRKHLGVTPKEYREKNRSA